MKWNKEALQEKQIETSVRESNLKRISVSVNNMF